MQALSQLSYGPGCGRTARISLGFCPCHSKGKKRCAQSQLSSSFGADVGDVLEIDAVLLVLEDLVVEVVAGLDHFIILFGLDLGQILDVDRLRLQLLGALAPSA